MLQGKNCTLKPYDIDLNYHDYIKNINDPDVIRYWNFQYPLEKKDYDNWEKWIRDLRLKRERFESFAIYFKNTFAGVISVRSIKDYPRNWASIGYWLGKTYWNNGIATDAVSIVCDYSFYSLDIIKLEAYVFRDNIASIKVLEKNSFNLEGILRKDYNIKGIISDELIYSRWK
jgi:RimJ/RimL family protein N-acetyltransferase